MRRSFGIAGLAAAELVSGLQHATLTAEVMRPPHRIGPGRRSILTLHNRVAAAEIRRAQRRLAGRHVWP